MINPSITRFVLIAVYLLAMFLIIRYFKNQKTTVPYSPEWYSLIKGLVAGIVLMAIDLSILYLK